MQIKSGIAYLVITKASRLPSNYQIIMIDGTVPSWEAKPGDLHWDHHRLDGADIQIDEIPLPQTRSLLEECAISQHPCFVTTMVDADACGAATWVQLLRQVVNSKPSPPMMFEQLDMAWIPDPSTKRSLLTWDKNTVMKTKARHP